MRFGSTAKVLAKCKLKYYRISECRVMINGRDHSSEWMGRTLHWEGKTK